MSIYNFKDDKPLTSEFAFIKTIKHTLEIENCSVIDPSRFIVNTKFYIESTLHNNCLNKKLCINEKGEIKNCIGSSKCFGDIYNFDPKKLCLDEEFTSKWNITKDDIKGCNICEYRYMCPDCRVFRKDEDLFSKPKRCMYNPYEATWENSFKVL